MLKSERTPAGKVVKVGDHLFRHYWSRMAAQSDMDSEVSGTDAEVAGALAEVPSLVLPTRGGFLLRRHSSCPEDDTNRRACFFFAPYMVLFYEILVKDGQRIVCFFHHW